MSNASLDDMLDQLQGTATGPHIDKYRRYRAIGKQLHKKIVTHPDYRRFFRTGSVHLGLQLEGARAQEPVETELAALFDYCQFELQERGKNFVQIYRETTLRHTREEEQLLDAYLQAEANLFRVTGANPDAGYLTLQELTDPSRHVTVIDVNMSASHARIQQELIILFRPVVVDDFVMGSGFSCLFPVSKERALLKDWIKYPSSVRFAKTFRTHKAGGGLPMMLR